MMRHFIDEEIELLQKIRDPDTTDEEKERISQRLREIEREILRDCKIKCVSYKNSLHTFCI